MSPTPRIVAPKNIAEAVSILAEHGEDALVLAGGQTLVPLLWRQEMQPAILVDLRRIAELRVVQADRDSVSFGAMVTVAQICDASEPALPELAYALGHVGNAPVRNCATLGGSIMLCNPHSEILAALHALNAELHFATAHGARTVPIAALLEDTLPADCGFGAVLTAIRIPRPVVGEGHGFAKITTRLSGGLGQAAAYARCIPSGAGKSDLSVTLSGETGLPRTICLAEAEDDDLDRIADILTLQLVPKAAPLPAARRALAAVRRSLDRLVANERHAV